MALGMQDFDFAQIQSNLPKSNHFCPNFAQISPQFCPNLTKFAQMQSILPKKCLLGYATASPAQTALPTFSQRFKKVYWIKYASWSAFNK